MDWPDWWEWELEISVHCRKRMVDRRFSEVDLRTMLEDATRLIEQGHGSFLVETTQGNVRWEIVVSPDDEKQTLIVITAYPVS